MARARSAGDGIDATCAVPTSPIAAGSSTITGTVPTGTLHSARTLVLAAAVAHTMSALATADVNTLFVGATVSAAAITTRRPSSPRATPMEPSGPQGVDFSTVDQVTPSSDDRYTTLVNPDGDPATVYTLLPDTMAQLMNGAVQGVVGR